MNFAESAEPSCFQSKSPAWQYRLSLRWPSASGWVNTAMPEESGPRSVMPTSIGTISSPRRGRRESFFSSNPTIPHISALRQNISPSEHFKIAARFPVTHVPRVLHPFHAFELDELLRQIGPEPLLHHFIGFERIDRFFQRLR